MPWDQVMNKWKAGTLLSGGSGKPVKSQGQAVAIMLSEKKKANDGNPEYKSSDGIHWPGSLTLVKKKLHHGNYSGT